MHAYIEVDYTASGFTVKELPFEWEDVAEWWIKYNVLNIELRNGDQHEFPLTDDIEIDTKRPSVTRIWPCTKDGSVTAPEPMVQEH